MSRSFTRAALGLTCLAVLSTTSLAQGDTCATATPITDSGVFGVVALQPFTTCGFAAPGPVLSCNGITDIRDGWFLYTATLSGAATFSLCPLSTVAPGGSVVDCVALTAFDSVMAAYNSDAGGGPGTDCPITNPELGCNDDGGGCFNESELTFGVTAGQSYWIAIGDWAGTTPGMSGTLAFVVNLALAAPNDTPAGATVQIGAGFLPDNNGPGFSLIDGPFPGCGFNPANDLWYYFFPTLTGTMTVTTCPGAGSGNGNLVTLGDSVIGIWADNGFFAPGAAISCNDDNCGGGPGLASSVTVPCASGVGVFVSVSGYNGQSGSYVVDFTEALAIGNDECLTALPLVMGPNVGLSNVGATGSLQPGTCRPAGDPDVWYTYTATAAGTVEFSMCPADGGSNGTIGTNAGLTAYSGVCGALTQVECNDGDWRTASGCNFTNSRLQATVTAGQTVYLSVSGFLGAQGTFDLGVNEFPSIPGHTCANAAVIATGQHFIDTTSDGIAHDGNSPLCMPAGDFNGNFVGAWYAWTATCQGGTAILNTCATTGLFGPEDTVVEVWTGCPGTLGATQIGCNDDDGQVNCTGSFFQSYLQFPVTAGQTYYLYVGGWEGGQGPITFDISCIYRHVWQEQNGPGTYSIQLENVDGPPNALVISAVTLDILHAGLPVNATFPNGWFFGVPMGVQELITQITWPGGLPFFHNLDGAGYKLNLQAPNGTTFGFGVGGLNASIWSVGVAFDPATGFATVQQVTAPTTYVFP